MILNEDILIIFWVYKVNEDGQISALNIMDFWCNHLENPVNYTINIISSSRLLNDGWTIHYTTISSKITRFMKWVIILSWMRLWVGLYKEQDCQFRYTLYWYLFQYQTGSLSLAHKKTKLWFTIKFYWHQYINLIHAVI